ncbi:MAG: hypothetical protein AB7F36_15020 [Reyranellaceae bacterium]
MGEGTKSGDPRERARERNISDPAGFYRQGLGPGYPEEEFGPGDKARKAPDEPASIRNWRGDLNSRFDRPSRSNPGIGRRRRKD